MILIFSTAVSIHSMTNGKHDHIWQQSSFKILDVSQGVEIVIEMCGKWQ